MTAIQNATLEYRDRLLSIPRAELEPSGQVNFDIFNDTIETFLEGNVWAEYVQFGIISP